ncbi:MAG: [acyl-carrier-protein] S-malonyltransferase [Flavobacteriaceae bacterium]|nr:[acyl-carrier-protein] S-malonyltransferase [Flavobacteriaceae bacterium]OUX39233.1 MAG: [acyl-carrier-protein] S-malonyltransferase [Flavobacteriaceae bacterium TMED265]
MKAYVFPGQGAQFTGMGLDLYENNALGRDLFKSADDILGFSISKTMFEGTPEELKQTKVTQPAIFIHSVIIAKLLGENFKPDMVAGHSLGEFSALVAAGALSFEDGLRLVSERAQAMQEACDVEKGTMAAILGLEDQVVEQLCQEQQGDVVAANYNCPGQLVISGQWSAVEAACESAKEKGARRALLLPVGGAFHSPLMKPARERLEQSIQNTNFQNPICPVYQNTVARGVDNAAEIKTELIAQLTSAVRWTQSVQNMIADGANEFIELGPGKVLQGLVKKIDRAANTSSGNPLGEL